MSDIDFQAGLQLAHRHLSELEDAGRAALVLIDGRAGSGKSHFAKALTDAFFQEHQFTPKVVAMDDLYPGWNGLLEGSVYLLESILLPLSKQQQASWQVWDWERSARGRDEVGNGFRSHDPGNPLIVEGCGSLSKSAAELATLRIWIESDPGLRRERYSQRDAGAFDEYFGIWAAQEDEFYAEHKSKSLSDLIIAN